MPARSLGQCLGENVVVHGCLLLFLPCLCSDGCQARTGLGYRCYATTPFGKMHCKWQPPGRPFGFHLAMGSMPVQMLCMHAPPKISIKEVHAAPQGSLFGWP